MLQVLSLALTKKKPPNVYFLFTSSSWNKCDYAIDVYRVKMGGY